MRDNELLYVFWWTFHKIKQSHFRQILFFVRSEVLTIMTMKITVFWNVVSSKLVDRYQHLGKPGCLYLQSRKGLFYTEDEGNRCPPNVCIYIYIYIYQATWPHSSNIASLFVYIIKNQTYFTLDLVNLHWTLWTYVSGMQRLLYTFHTFFGALTMECYKNMPMSFIISVCLHACNSSRTDILYWAVLLKSDKAFLFL
jgi:hypothetical protein